MITVTQVHRHGAPTLPARVWMVVENELISTIRAAAFEAAEERPERCFGSSVWDEEKPVHDSKHPVSGKLLVSIYRD